MLFCRNIYIFLIKSMAFENFENFGKCFRLVKSSFLKSRSSLNK